MPKPMFTKVNEEKSVPYPIKPGTTWNGFTSNECPASTHRKKVHVGRVSLRQTVTVTWGDGRKSRSYIDECVCQFCGHTWSQEWMPAGI